MRILVKKQQSNQKFKKTRLNYQHKVKTMNDIEAISEKITGKEIVATDIVYGEDILVLHLHDGSSVEIIIDSIYLEEPTYDD